MFEKYEPGIVAREAYASFVFCHGFIMLSFINVFPASLIPQLKEEGYFISTTTEALLGSITPLTAAICTLFVPLIISKSGRKTMLQISSSISIVGISILALSSSVSVICCGILVVSAASSIVIPITICYISEICQKERRGVLLSGSYVMLTAGASMVYSLHGFLSWRMIAAVGATITLFGFLQSFLIPESKYWHVLKNDDEKAKKALRWLQPTLSDIELDKIIDDMKLSIDERSSTAANGSLFFEFVRNLRNKKVYQPLLKAILLSFIRGGCGRSIFGTYFITIVQDLKISYDVKILSLSLGMIEFFGSIVILYLTSKFKRKSAIFLYLSVMMISVSTIVVYKILLNFGILLPAFIPTLGIYVYMMIVMCGFNSLATAIASEIQVAIFRAEANSITGAFALCSFSFHAWIFPYARQIVPFEYVSCYFIFCMVSAMLFIHFGFPETSKFEFYENENKTDTDEINLRHVK